MFHHNGPRHSKGLRMAFELVATPYRKQDLPVSRDEVLQVAQQMADGVEKGWKKGKLYKFKNPGGEEHQVQTYSVNHGSEFWLSRRSTHKISRETYDQIIRYLNGSERAEDDRWVLEDRTTRSRLEKEYIEVLSDFEILEVTSSGWVLVNLEYDLGKPLTIRDFNEWVYPIEPFTEAGGTETSMVVSLNADVPMKQSSVDKNHTPAYYVSVERLRYNYKTQELEWLMCTTSDAGGNVPKWIQNATIAKTVAKDVPYLFEFLAKHANKT